MAELIDGLVVKSQSGFYAVRTEQGEVACRLRGRLKKERLDTDLVAAGDRVRISLAEDGTGMIEQVDERQRALGQLERFMHIHPPKDHRPSRHPRIGDKRKVSE